MMRRPVFLTLSLLFVPQSTLEVDVNFVNVFVTVQEADGRYAEGLSRDDFRIFEDGEERRIETFEASDLASSLGILIDSSGSSAGGLDAVKSGIVRFTRRLGTEDEMFAVSFGTDVNLVHAFSDDVEELPRALSRLRSWGTSVFYDALNSSLATAIGGSQERKALIVFSDGYDNGSETSYLEVVRRAQSHMVMLYFIAIGPGALIDTYTLEGLASMTGGRLVVLGRDQSPDLALEEIRQDLAHHYYLGYHASTRSGYHSIRVEVPGRDLNVRARDGYLVTR